MATKPTEIPVWATNTTYTVGPDIGSPTKLATPESFEQQGHIPGAANPPIAQYENWRQNKIGEWLEWLDETTAFGQFEFVSQSTADGVPFDVTEIAQSGGFTLFGTTQVEVPTAGVYEINVSLWCTVTNASSHSAYVKINNVIFFQMATSQLTDPDIIGANFTFSGIVEITTPATELITIEAGGPSAQTPFGNSRHLSMKRIF